MKTLTKERLVGFLVKHKACKPGLDWAKAQVSARDIIEKFPSVNHLRWLIEAIGGPLWAEYNEKECQIWAEHCKKAHQPGSTYTKKYRALTREICTFERVQEAIGA